MTDLGVVHSSHHRELERKVEKVKCMKLEVMRPKTKDNMNFQPLTLNKP